MNNSQYTLSYLPQFYVDFSNAVLYIKNELQNPTAAKKLVGEVKKAIEKRLPNCEAFEPYISKHERRYKYYRLAMPKSNTVTTVCNSKREVWTDYEEAKAYFLELMMSTDGEERERAECVYIQLMHGLDECSDED